MTASKIKYAAQVGLTEQVYAASRPEQNLMAKKQLLRRPKTNSEYEVSNPSATHGRRVTFEGYATIGGRELWMFHPVRSAGKNKP